MDMKNNWSLLFWLFLVQIGPKWKDGDQMHQGALSAFAAALCGSPGYPSVHPGPAPPPSWVPVAQQDMLRIVWRFRRAAPVSLTFLPPLLAMWWLDSRVLKPQPSTWLGLEKGKADLPACTEAQVVPGLVSSHCCLKMLSWSPGPDSEVRRKLACWFRLRY